MRISDWSSDMCSSDLTCDHLTMNPDCTLPSPYAITRLRPHQHWTSPRKSPLQDCYLSESSDHKGSGSAICLWLQSARSCISSSEETCHWDVRNTPEPDEQLPCFGTVASVITQTPTRLH